MKNTILLVTLYLLCITFPVFSQCADESVITDKNQIIGSKNFILEEDSEVSAIISTSSLKTSWRKKDSEAIAVTVFIDGKYHQDLLLFKVFENEDKNNKYEVFIGDLKRGKHRLEIIENNEYSSINFRNRINLSLKINLEYSAKKQSIEEIEDLLARANAPFIYARPNTLNKFSDIPLVLYYEIFKETNGYKKIRYSVIFSHEDGGTNSQALMARWGRMTDIEWMYEITLNEKNEKLSEIYQGANHIPTNFNGKRIFGSHPIIYNITDNNNFADAGCSALRFAIKPYKADLTKYSRETLMETFPWTYRIMSDEILREDKVNSNKMSANIIGDPREYIFVEIYQEPENAAVSVSATLNDGRKISSDWGNKYLRVERVGYVRIALHIPANIVHKDIKELSLDCYAQKSEIPSGCKNIQIKKIVELDENFIPIETQIISSPKTVKANESAVFQVRTSKS